MAWIFLLKTGEMVEKNNFCGLKKLLEKSEENKLLTVNFFPNLKFTYLN